MKICRIYKTFVFIIVLGGAIVFSNQRCSGQKISLVNTYKRIVETSEEVSDGSEIVSLDFSSSPYTNSKKETESKTIFNLGEKAQKELIKAYSSKDTSSLLLRKSLVEPLEKKVSEKEKVFNYKFNKIHRKLSFKIEDVFGKSPNNRIESLEIELHIDNRQVNFLEFIDYQTTQLYYDIGTLEATSNRNFSISLGGAIGHSDTNNTYSGSNLLTSGINSNEFTPSVTYGKSNSLKENVSLRKRYISQAGFIAGDKCVIYMEGNPDLNLNGIVNIGITLEIADPSLKDFEYATYKFDKDKATLNRKILFAPTAFDIIGDIKFSFVYRNIERGGKSPVEGRHVVSYYKFNDVPFKKNPVTIVPEDDFTTSLFCLKVKGIDNVYFKHVSNNVKHRVAFLTLEEAFSFREYIRKINSTSFNGYTLVDKKGNAIESDDAQRFGIRSERLVRMDE